MVLTRTHTHRWRVTHPAHSFEVILVSSEVDELAVEGPGEGGIQRRVAGHLAGQHHTLAHDDLRVRGPHRDPAGL